MANEKYERNDELELVNMIDIKECRIENAPSLSDCHADAIVNAANPTLRGDDNTNTVDGAIHNAIAQRHGGNKDYLKNKIKRKIHHTINVPDCQIRCKRGEVVTTPGYGLCKKIIHTVGAVDDSGKKEQVDKEGKIVRFLKVVTGKDYCSSSCIETLGNCYKNVILEAMKYPEIESLAIPVIGSGNYKISFELALRVAIASVYNTLLEKKQKDQEFFKYCSLKKIWIVVPKKGETAKKELEKYMKYFRKEVRVVDRCSWTSQMQFLRELQLYDKNRGYFSIARQFRKILVLLRAYVFGLSNFLKDIIGRKNWELRRCVVEFYTVFKILVPVFAVFCIRRFGNTERVIAVGTAVLVYCMLDTMTYLVSLIVLADIQRPSANVIRSLIMLCINYIEVSLEMTALSYFRYYGAFEFRKALEFGLLGTEIELWNQGMRWVDYLLLYANAGIKFVFLTFVFGYFANHLVQRKFR